MSAPAQSGGSALGSVLALERALEAKRAASDEVTARLETARADAKAILAAARERADARAAQRRESLLEAARTETNAIGAEAELAAAQLYARAQEIEKAFVAKALAIVLPRMSGETKCSNQ